MTRSEADGSENESRWSLRAVPPALVERYLAEGWWDDRSLGELIHEALAGLETTPFKVFSDVRPYQGTIGEVAAQARSFGGWLTEHDIGPGDVVVMQAPNWREAAITFWGAAFAGAIVVPVVHFYGPKELDHILRVTRPSLVVTPQRFGRTDYIDGLAELIAGHQVPWAVIEDGSSTLPDHAIGFESTLASPPLSSPLAVDPDTPAIIAFTSGTTRDPKGVIHSHRTIGFEGRQAALLSPVGGPPPLVVAPVGHFIGMLSALFGSLIRRVPINLLDVWNAERVLELMLDEGVSLTGGAPYFFTSLLEHPAFTDEHLAHIPAAGLGGSPVPVPFARRLAGLGIEVMRCYGSTEHPSISGCSFDEDPERRILTDGHALEGVEIRLDGEGQIYSRGPELFVGYTDPELTAEVFDDDGWYRTGDVGVLDDEGFLAITDRVSDLIIRGGENISAQEVEDLLLGMDAVAEVSVVAEPDERFGERAVAVVRVLGDMPAPSLDAVRAHLAEAGLAKQKWPESLRFVTDFPRTPSGKVQKFLLRQQIRDHQLAHEVVPADQD